MMSMKLLFFNIPTTWLIHFIWRFVSLAALFLVFEKKNYLS
jgi:hypothetical protein